MEIKYKPDIYEKIEDITKKPDSGIESILLNEEETKEYEAAKKKRGIIMYTPEPMFNLRLIGEHHGVKVFTQKKKALTLAPASAYGDPL